MTEANAYPPTTLRGGAMRIPYGALATLYALTIVYVSVAFSRYGFNFVPLGLAETWAVFVDMPFLQHGSDQRQDWMANLMMLGLLGFLAAGALARGGRLGTTRGIVAASLCIAFLLAVKFVQIWFPPRTVSINYVLAQSTGSILGVITYGLLHGRLDHVMAAFAAGTGKALTALLAIYAGLLAIFLLFPFDFTLDAADLSERLERLPALLVGMPFPDRPAALRLVLVVAGTLVMVPLGMLLRRVSPQRSRGALYAAGIAIVIGLFVLTLFILNATPNLVALGYRCLGVLLGIHLMEWIARGGLARAEPWLLRLAPWLVVPYLFAALAVKGVLASDWLTTEEAFDQFIWRGMLPFWHLYLGAKTQALRSMLAHALIFAPIGIFLRMTLGGRPRHALLAAMLAAGFAFAIELARAYRPGLQVDLFTVPIIAAASATITLLAAAWLWRVLARADEVVPEDARIPVAAANLPPVAEAAVEEPEPPEIPLPPSEPSLAGGIVAGAATAAIGAILYAYPIAPWALIAALVAFAAILWRWPAAWLTLLPAAIVAFDFMPWTGWLLFVEADLFVLAAVAILALRRRPAAADLLPRGVALAALGLYAIVNLLGVVLGLTNAAEPFSASANLYLHPLNALRASKGLWVALLLLPFVIHDWRHDRRMPVRLAQGFSLALAVAVAGVVVERLQFTGLTDFISDYRVVSTFPGMHLGGSQIGIFLVMALPFTVVLLTRGQPPSRLAVLVLQIAAAYALIVTYARASYAAAIIGIFVVSIASLVAARRPVRSARAQGTSLALPLIVMLIGGGSVAFAAFGSSYMQERFRGSGGDFESRLANWTDGLAIRDRGLSTMLIGMGTGTFPRINLLRGPMGKTPSDYRPAREGERHFLSVIASSTVYVGQKIDARADRSYELTALWRAPDGKGTLHVALCEKLVLYSANCTGASFAAAAGAQWTRSTAILSPHVLAGAGPGWLPARPFDLAFWNPVPNTQVDIAEIGLRDPAGRELVANGDFARGIARWYVSDDYHWPWRLENEFVTALFDGGLVRLGVLLLLFAVATTGAIRLVMRGSPAGPAVLAALLTFVAMCIFDAPLQAPRLATLFYLIAFVGLLGVGEAVALAPAAIPAAKRRRRRGHGRPDPRSGTVRSR